MSCLVLSCQIVDANGEPIKPDYVLKCQLQIGTPKLIIETEFFVIKSLPFIEPYSSAIVDVRATGPGLDKFRPESHVSVLAEGVDKLCDRLSVEVYPSVNILHHQNCQQKIQIHNISPKPKVVAKGVKIAHCSSDFDICDLESCGVNLISESENPIDILCSKMKHLDPVSLKEARKFLEGYSDLFTVSSTNIGQTNVQQFEIDDNNLRPVTVPLRRVPIHHKEIVEQLIARYEQLNLLEPIDSPFRASTVLVAKKNPSNSPDVTDQYCLCTDYRALNKHIPSSGWPAPSIDECLDSLGNADMFSSLDFNNGYFQLPSTEHAKQCLVFSPGYGFRQYTWKVMPQGLKTASGCFQQAMLKTFSGHESCILPPFYDDVTIKSRGFKEHLSNAKVILDDVRAAKFTLNALKCSFFQKQIKYLGHIISEHSVEIDPDRIKAIINLQPPTDTKSLRRFIGMIQFCSKFVDHLNVILAPLYELLKTKSKFVWSAECQRSFDSLKRIMVSPPVLYSPTTKDRFILETDASDVGLGGCLKAVNAQGTRIVGFCSKKIC